MTSHPEYSLRTFCPSCGAELPFDAHFCSECGSAVPSSSTPSSNPHSARPTPPPYGRTRPTAGSKAALVKLLGGLGVLSVLAGIFLPNISFGQGLFIAFCFWILSGVLQSFWGIED